MKKSKPILLVEDDNVDAMTVERALKDLRITDKLVRATNGEEALDYLRISGGKRPSVILLDLNMPKMDGIEFLKIAKNDEEMKKIPVVVLTTSKDKRDVVESFKNNAAGYMVKPADYKKFVEAIRTIKRYWTLSELPNGG